MPERPPVSRAEGAALALLLAVGLALRAWGAGFGLPHTYHPDEHQYVETALAVVGGDPDPGRFNNPTLFKYALAAADLVWLALSGATGGAASVPDLQARIAADPSSAYLLARLLVAALGTATVLAVWALGRAGHDRRTALLAAALLAVSYLHVRESHFAVGDVPATLLVTLALVWSLRLLAGASTRDYLLAGAWVGLAAGTKYTGALAAVAVALGHLMAEGAPLRAMPGRLADRRPWLAAAAALAAFLAAVPYAVLRWPAFSADIALLAERGRVGFKGLALSPEPGWRFYLSALDWGMGWPFLLAAVVALLAALAGRRRDEALLAVYALATYAYLSPQLLLFERFLLPVLPALAVLTAALLVRVADRVARPRRRAAALGLALAAIALAPLARSLRFDWLLAQTDTRALATAWIEANVPAGARITVQSNGPQLTGGDRQPPAGAVAYDLEVVGTTELEERPLEAYGPEGIAYVVLSSFSTERRLLDPVRDAARRAYFADLDARFERIAAFRPYVGPDPPAFRFAQVYGPATDLWRLERPGPELRVYRVR